MKLKISRNVIEWVFPFVAALTIFLAVDVIIGILGSAKANASEIPESSWDTLIGAIRQDPTILRKAVHINRWVDERVDYEWDEDDDWQTPIDTMRHGRGDCEDYAIMKLEGLLQAGVNPNTVFIGIMWDGRSETVLHAVTLLYDPVERHFLVLDLGDRPVMTLYDYQKETGYVVVGFLNHTDVSGAKVFLGALSTFSLKITHEHTRYLDQLKTRGDTYEGY